MGPVLLNLEDLARLDSILDRASERLEGNELDRIAEDVDRELSEGDGPGNDDDTRAVVQRHLRAYREQHPAKRVASVTMKSGNEFRDSTLRGIADCIRVEQETPVEFQIDFELAGLTVVISSRKKEWLTPQFFSLGIGDTRKNESPETMEARAQIRGELIHWYDDVLPPWHHTVVRMLNLVNPLLWLSLVMLVCFWNSFFSTLHRDFYERSVKKELKEMAHSLLEGGIDDRTEELKAIEVQLALASDYYATECKAKVNERREIRWLQVCYWTLIVVGFLVCLATTRCPALVIGIGKGRRQIAVWRKWLRLVSIAVPSFIGTGIVFPIIVDYVSSWLTSAG